MSNAENMSEHRPIARLASELPAFKTQFDVFRFMKRATEICGFRSFMIFNMPATTSLDLSSNSIITNWPAELLSSYDQSHLLSTSPVIRHIRTSSVPLQYDFDEPGQLLFTQGQEEPRQLFTRFNMPRGVHFPVHDATGARGVVTFAGDRPLCSVGEMAEIAFLCMHVFDRLAQIRELDSRATEVLSEREIDCLNWTAAGKTSVEIAEILGLSEHTINHYLNRATKKLDTVNRTQAVAKALRIGLIK